MASPDQVKQYLAYWFQLGKRIVLHNGREALLPSPVLWGDRYSPEFEKCWQRVTAADSGDCYLEGTNQTIAQLLTSGWEIHPCVRCEMPVPMPDLGAIEPGCPCSDLDFWPDLETPRPRSPVNSTDQLNQIRDRLLNHRHSSSSAPEQRENAVSSGQYNFPQSSEDEPSLDRIRDRLRSGFGSESANS